jgi:hypothetical protein
MSQSVRALPELILCLGGLCLITSSPKGDVIPMRQAREGSYEKHRTITDAGGTDDPVRSLQSKPP